MTAGPGLVERMKSRLRYAFFLCLILATLLIGVGAGVVLDRVPMTALAASDNGPDLKLLTQAWQLIDQNYVDRSALLSTELTYGAIAGMVGALGDTGHSTFLTPGMVKQEQQLTQGQFTGIGLELQSEQQHVVIVAPLDGSPAQRAGLQAGEIILQVNGQAIDGLPLDQVIARILGPAGTPVTLTIIEPKTGQTMDVTLVRARIVLQSVSWEQIPGTTIADVRVSSFSQGETADLIKALNEIKQQKMTGIILDLRNNPGGLLDEAVDTASQFLKGGNVLLEKDAAGQVTAVAVRSGGIATDIPMVVLINGGTASAAEIVSGALQDAHRAELVGGTTFGTGTVLNQFPLSDGSALLLATQEWLSPAGRVIWHKGIPPDESVSLPANTAAVTADALRGMTAQQVQASGDTQLLDALKLISK